MKPTLIVILFASTAVVVSSVIAQKVDRRVDLAKELRAVVQAERAFARMAAERGTRAAFLANMTDDAVVFDPGHATNAKKLWSERPDRPGLLSWEPVYADVARSGDMGYTTGPWEFRPNGPADKPVGFGEFFTVWRKQTDGTWKWELDLGVSHPAREGAPPSLTFPADFRQNTDRDKLDVGPEKTKGELLKAEREFATAAARDAGAAFEAHAADDVRLLREGRLPVVGKEAARRLHASAPAALVCENAFASGARSGELGYTYGTYELKPAGGGAAERGNYARVWKKKADGKWRIVLGLLNPLPAPRPAG